METKAIRSSWVVLLGAALLFGAAEAAAQGSPAPGANQAFLYELDEDAVLLNAAGNVLPSAGIPPTVPRSTPPTVPSASRPSATPPRSCRAWRCSVRSCVPIPRK